MIPKHQALAVHRTMLRIRLFEERVAELVDSLLPQMEDIVHAVEAVTTSGAE